MVSVEGLTKSFGEVRALNEVDLAVEEGTVLGLLGPNGVGKTTAVRILATLLPPDGGHATVAGLDVVRDAELLRTTIGLAGQFAAVDPNLTGMENLEMVGRLYHVPRREARRRVTEILDRFDPLSAANRTAKTYSGGMKRRLDLGASLVGRPQVLFLDELTTGLDPRSRVDVWDLIRQLVRDGTTLLLTTQHLDEVDALSKEIAVIDDGRVIANGTPDELKDKVGGTVLDVRVDREHLAEAADALYGIACGGQQVDNERSEMALPVGTDGPAALTEAVRRLDAVGVTIADLAYCKPTLNDVFLALTGRAVAKTTAGDGGAREDGSDEPGRRKRRRVRRSR